MAHKPVAVLISDIHFNVPNLELATRALLHAQDHAVGFGVPLIIAGDLTDTKAIIRGEVANRLIELFDNPKNPRTYVIVGNHDLINEKAKAHALNFLRPYATVIDEPTDVNLAGLDVTLIPYQSSGDELRAILDNLQDGETIIMHQGLLGADMGHYVQDKTSLPPEAFERFRVISGHYHKAQDIKTGRPRKGAVGLFSYIGSPYTMTFGEANDGPKGFAVLYDDGLLERIPTGLRRHVVVEMQWDEKVRIVTAPGDLIWVKVHGPFTELERLDKGKLGQLLGTQNFKLEKIPTDAPVLQVEQQKLTGEELMDKLIDATAEAATEKKSLKKLWRSIA